MKLGSLCALLWRILSWCTRKQVTVKARHIPGRLNVIADKLSRLGQTIQTEWSLHPEVFPSYMLLVAPTTSGPVCHQIQQQTTTVCVTGSRSPGMGSGCTQPVMGRSEPICLPTSSHRGQSGEVAGLPLQQDHPDSTRVAQNALVLGSSGNVQSHPLVSAQPGQSGVSTIQPDPAQEPVKPEPTCLAPRATAIKEQGFSEAVAAKIEAPQRGSTRSVCEPKWTIFTKWCLSNQVDFRAPPLKDIVDFLLHLFQDRKLQHSTIDGYRSAIADKLGNSTINVSKDENLTRLLDSFHRDRPKGRRAQIVWLQWSYQSLCPVRALRYYLDRTSDLRHNKLVFVSFKKGFDKDISCATISSLIKQTVILCYELSDQEALTLHQVKAHDVRAFVASKAFQSGVSLEQILSACHWKFHNTFTQFYLKDAAWADTELFHLGPVVAAQQVHHQAQKGGDMYICKYVYMYMACTIVYNIKKNKKKTNKQNCDLLPLGSLFLMGLNSTLASYSQSRSEKRGGGGYLGLPDNRLVLADLDLWGHLTRGQNGPSQLCSFMSSCMSLAAYPPSKI